MTPSSVVHRLSSVAGRPSSVVRQWSLATALFAAVAALLFIRQLAPDRVLVPVDVLFMFPPYADAAARLGVVYPENPLVADTILQNVGWRQHARDEWLRGEAPLWNPHILTGQPFLATAQNASLYPPGALFFVLPLPDAYEAFAVVHFTLAGVFMAMLLASLGAGWLGRVIGGLTFELCGFLVVSVVWPMMVSTAVWLPLLLCVVERIIAAGGNWRSTARWAALGIAATSLQLLAGHLEISFYILATSGLYAALRLAPSRGRRLVPTLGAGATLLGMVAAGALLAAVQIVPFVEAIGQNVRVGQVSFSDVQGYAFDRGQWWTFVLPDFFGNPTHRTYLDARDLAIHSVDHVRTRGGGSELRRDTEWGRRNYVEGGAYLGVTALLLGLVGAVTGPRRGWPFLAIALASLLFAFGTPLYALVFYGLPGGNQVHTPFRWVYPWTVCLAVLAGLGADALSRQVRSAPSRRAVAGIAALTIAIGGLAAVTSAALWLAAARQAPVLETMVARWSEIQDGFVDGAAFGSYVAPQVLGLAVLLILAGALVLMALKRPSRSTVALLAGLLAVDLWTFGVGFNPAGQRSLLDFTPGAVTFLQGQPGPFRIAALGPEDVLPTNLAMRVGLDDIRGYDTIIRRDYVDYLGLIERPGALLYSKVEKLFDERSLSSPLFHALNVGYVLSARPISQPGYELAHSEGVHVYRNTRALPRAFIVAEALGAGSADEALEALRRIDPASTVVIESNAIRAEPIARPEPLRDARAQIARYEAQEIIITITAPASGYLVLMDAYDPGWIAQVDGRDTPVLRANHAFRAVEVPAGVHEIRMLYRPLSFRVGLLLSAIGGLILVAVTIAAFWPARRGLAEVGPLATVLRNISAPFAANLVSRVLDLGLALVMFRFLGPTGVGAYTFAVVLTGYLDILAGFGLATLVTRDAARQPERLATYFGNSLLARGGFWLIAALVAWVVIGPLGGPLEVSPDLALAVTLLVVGLLPSGYSAALSALLQARERFDVPAAATVVSAVLKILLGLAALLAGWGFVGLAAVSIVTNLITAALLTLLASRAIGLPRPRVDTPLTWAMVVAAYPLMLSQVLNALFFRIDALLLKPLAGDEALGWYSTAFRFIDAFQIIPSTVILALFPLISRQADDRAAIIGSATLTMRALLGLAFPIAVGCTVLAEPIILAFAGASYIPQSVVALQILIWYLPLSFINGLAQYVLIARGRQKILTVAFAIGVLFNLAANLVLIPTYGYQAAAWITVASELVLLLPFWIVLRSEQVGPDLWRVAWRPIAAALAMAAVMWPIAPQHAVLAGLLGAIVYAASLIALRGVSADELRTLRRAL
jgi:O-antigen/teichoic acid export membrane protein